jgi:hypothetical protein
MTIIWFCNTPCHYRYMYCNTLLSFTKILNIGSISQFCSPSIGSYGQISVPYFHPSCCPSFPASGNASIPFPPAHWHYNAIIASLVSHNCRSCPSRPHPLALMSLPFLRRHFPFGSTFWIPPLPPCRSCTPTLIVLFQFHFFYLTHSFENFLVSTSRPNPTHSPMHSSNFHKSWFVQVK